MLFKKICLVIFAGMMIHSGVSCSDSNNDKEITTQNMNVQTAPAVTEPPVFNEKDLGEIDFTFLVYNEHATKYTDNYIWADTDGYGQIHEAVAQRNSDTEGMYNIKIEADEVFSPKNEATSRIQAGQCDFDVILEWGTNASSLALDGLLVDFNDLKAVDLDRCYWVSSAREDLTVGGKMYIASSYIALYGMNYADVLFFNKTMYEELGYTESLYDSVTSGTWTIDKLVDLAVSASSDLNGDGEMTSADRYGFWGSTEECLVGLVKSTGAKNSVKNSDGSYSLDVYNEKIVDIYTRFESKLNSKENFITYESIWQELPNLTEYSSRAEGARFLGFGEGHVLFMPGTLSLIGEFEKMQDDYGILPNPVYDAEQSGYCHFIDCGAPMLSVPKSGSDVAVTGLILEYMAYSSENYLIPAYEEATVGAKREPDPNDEKMLWIIRNSLRYEWTELYNLTVTNTILDRMMASGSFRSVYDRLCSKAMAEINGCIDTLSFIDLE